MPAIRLVTEVPGPASRALIARREAATPRGAAKLTQVAVARADGATLEDVDGNRLLDFAGGIGMMALGHRPAGVVAAVHAQVDAFLHVSAIVASYESYVRLAELLCETAPMPGPLKAVLLNSGAEAVETAVKIARSSSGRQAIVVFEGAYHGRTNLTLAMTSKYGLFKSGFGPFAPEIYRLPSPYPYRRPAGMSHEAYLDDCIARVEHGFVAQVDPSSVAALVIEPVLGEGGFVPIPPRFLRRLRELCDEHGMLLVADEIQSGMGRTGTLYAIEQAQVAPDLVTTAKSLASGLPVAAVVGRAEVMDAPHAGGLGGTYSGSPIACAAAIHTLEALSKPAFLAGARRQGERMRAALESLAAEVPQIGEVRGLGPMLALEFVHDAASRRPAPGLVTEVCTAALRRGLIVIRAGIHSNCLRLLPPLNIDDAVLDEGLAVLVEAVREVCTTAQTGAGATA